MNPSGKHEALKIGRRQSSFRGAVRADKAYSRTSRDPGPNPCGKGAAWLPPFALSDGFLPRELYPVAGAATEGACNISPCTRLPSTYL